MTRGLVARAAVTIHAPAAEVWHALVDPEMIKRYMFGSTAASDWKPGSPITFSGEWQGKRYEDKGMILRAEPGRVLEYTHFSPLNGLPDVPESYHTVKIEISERNNVTTVSLSQDNNATDQEREHSQKNWAGMLTGLKQLLEDQPAA